MRAFQTDALQQSFVELLGTGVEQLTGRGNRVFAYLLASEHPTEGIGHEENTFGILQGTIALLLHGIELEKGIEVHQLNTSDAVHLLLGDDLLEVSRHCFEGDGIAIGSRVAENGIVFADENEVHTPRVDTD